MTGDPCPSPFTSPTPAALTTSALILVIATTPPMPIVLTSAKAPFSSASVHMRQPLQQSPTSPAAITF